MRWQTKAAVQKGLSALPRSEQLNYVLQRRVTRGLPASDAQLELHFQEACQHLAAFERHGDRRSPADVRAFEFGAGWDLMGPLCLWALGVGSQTVVDIVPHVRWELVEHTVDQLVRLHDGLEELAERPLRPVRDLGAPTSPAMLRERFGIDYRAPVDARATGLAAGSFDLVTSTYTLEHIPSEDIAQILRECGRLLAPGGVVSSSIDLQDHYSFVDPRISIYNFLRYEDRIWRLVNSSLHHQNRLRARDHVELSSRAGLTLLERRDELPTDERVRALDALPLAGRFARDYEREELEAFGVYLVATRRG